MAEQYTSWVVAPFPTQIDTVPPVVSFVAPPTPLEGSTIQERITTYQWTADKADCEYRYKGSWHTDWSAWSTNPIAQSDNLPNGSYAFSVQAKDKFGNESAIITRSFYVLRELPVPVLIAPASSSVLANNSVAFVCEVPRGDDGQSWHFEFQIATDSNMIQLVENKTWFSSVDSYLGYSYTAPVPENSGGTITFSKNLPTRQQYWWKCRIRLAGTNIVSQPSAPRSFTLGTLGTRAVLIASKSQVRADGVATSNIRAEIQDTLQQIDTLWSGTIDFSIVSGTATFQGNPLGMIVNSGVASIEIKSDIINDVSITCNHPDLESVPVVVSFVANRLPIAPIWSMTPDELDFPTTTVSLVCDVPADLDNDTLHFKIEIDIIQTFDSPNLIVAESRFSTAGWEYFDGINWLAFLTQGIPQGTGKIRYTTTTPLKDKHQYYARIAAWDGIA